MNKEDNCCNKDCGCHSKEDIEKMDKNNPNWLGIGFIILCWICLIWWVLCIKVD